MDPCDTVGVIRSPLRDRITRTRIPLTLKTIIPQIECDNAQAARKVGKQKVFRFSALFLCSYGAVLKPYNFVRYL